MGQLDNKISRKDNSQKISEKQEMTRARSSGGNKVQEFDFHC